MQDLRQDLIQDIFTAQNANGFWRVIPPTHHHYPDHLHYVPNFRATLWTLILLADLGCDPDDERIQQPLQGIKEHFFDSDHGIYSLKEDHFPIPCLNGNMVYLDAYFNGRPDDKTLSALSFFFQNQRFDDGCYVEPKNSYCSNTECYGKHSCYWGVVKLLKGISFLPQRFRSREVITLRKKCIDFVLLHKVCYRSHKPGKIMIKGLDLLTFPNMYRSDFLEILWLLKREKVRSPDLQPALELLRSKQQENGQWPLEKKVHNMVTTVGEAGQSHPFITARAEEVLRFYEQPA